MMMIAFILIHDVSVSMVPQGAAQCPTPCPLLAFAVLVVSSVHAWSTSLSFSALVYDLLLRGGRGLSLDCASQKSI